jgi:hypothetical protein
LASKSEIGAPCGILFQPRVINALKEVADVEDDGAAVAHRGDVIKGRLGKMDIALATASPRRDRDLPVGNYGIGQAFGF